jgi:hypothetical protein
MQGSFLFSSTNGRTVFHSTGHRLVGIQTIEVTACMRPVSKCGHSFLRKPQGDSTTAKASQSSLELLLTKILVLMFVLVLWMKLLHP